MKTIQSCEISTDEFNGKWAYRDIKFERKKGSKFVKVTVPKGQRTEKTLSFTLNEEDLIQAAMWMRGEIR